jgi:hypothetical protein
VAPGTLFEPSYENFAEHYQVLEAFPALNINREVQLTCCLGSKTRQPGVISQ